MSELSLNNSIISQLSNTNENEDEIEFIYAFKNIFLQKEKFFEKNEDKEDENKLYYIEDDTNQKSEKTTKIQNTIIKKNLFNTKKEEETKLIHKKRGRIPKQKSFDAINGVHKPHDKNSMDNLLRKV